MHHRLDASNNFNDCSMDQLQARELYNKRLLEGRVLMAFIKIVGFDKWVKIDRSCVTEADSWKKLRQFILERDNFTCQYCGDMKGPFEADHVMPRSRGGLDTESNLVCACKTCNRSKSDKTPEEWQGVRNWQKDITG